MRGATLAALSVTLLVAAGLAWILLVADPRYSIDSFAGDDAGYYFAIARNICLGHGVTFDRVGETNGFNPLQTALLVVAYRFFAPGLSVIACYRIGVLVSLLALVAGGFFYARLVGGFLSGGWLRPEQRRLAMAACFAFYAWFVCLKNNFGIDGPLVLLLSSIYLVGVFRSGLLPPGLGPALVDGALLGLLFLARVDSLPFLAAAFVLMAVAAASGRAKPAAIVIRSVVASALVIPYLAWSFVHFGSWLPISARIKSSFPHANVGRSLDTILHTSLNPADQLSFLIAFVLAIAVAATWLKRRRDHPAAAIEAGRPAVLALLTVYLLGRFGYMLLFSRADVQGSYVLLAHVYNVLVGITVLQLLTLRMPALARERAVMIACTLLLALSAGLLTLKTRGVVQRWRAIEPGGAGDEMALAEAIHGATAPGDVLYGGAFGMLAFLSDRPWINGDGVANDAAYQRALRDGALERYLTERRVSHVVFLASPATPDSSRHIAVHGFLYGRDGSLTVDERQALLRWRSLRGGGAEVALARWTWTSGNAVGR